jgi:hypothetical protein
VGVLRRTAQVEHGYAVRFLEKQGTGYRFVPKACQFDI